MCNEIDPLIFDPFKVCTMEFWVIFASTLPPYCLIKSDWSIALRNEWQTSSTLRCEKASNSTLDPRWQTKLRGLATRGIKAIKPDWSPYKTISNILKYKYEAYRASKESILRSVLWTFWSLLIDFRPLIASFDPFESICLPPRGV